MRPILSTILVLAFASTVLAEPSLTGTATELSNYLSGVPQTVAVTGRAEIKVPADRAVIQLKVSTEDKLLQGALKKNQTIRNDTKTSLEKAGIAADRIKGSRFSSTPSYGLWSDKIKSYKVENIITVSVSNEDEFQLVTAELDKHPEISYQGMSFERSDKADLKQKAIAQACEAAVAKKKLFEEKLGVKLTIVRFAEAFSGPVPMQQRFIGGYAGKDGSMGSVAQVSNSISSEGGETVSQFDEMTFTAEVTLECKLQPVAQVGQ
jgi:uncharacterized protein